MFWKRYPSLPLALSLLIGICSSFYLYFLVGIFLLPKKKLWLLSLAGYLYCKLLHPSFPETDEGCALFHIEEIKPHVGPFFSSLVYSGTIKHFQSTNGIWHRIPCKFYTRKTNRVKGNRDYFIPKMTLKKTSPFQYVVKSHTTWIPIEKSLSLAEWRYQKKEKIKARLKKYYKEKRTYDLVKAVVTGNLENRILYYQFSCLGLNHLLVVSGFHFALLACILSCVLSKFFKQKIVALSLILLLSTYFFYMGKDSSINRAWIGVVVYLVGQIFSYRPIPINTLGIAFLFALIADPLVIFNIGFQLSFSASFGILFFFKLFEEKLEIVLPKRSFDSLKTMPFIEQIGYLLCTYIKKVAALNASVMITTLPFLLFYFKTFPLISVFYNLFFPLLFSVFITGLILSFLFPILHYLNASYAGFLLDLVAEAPKKLMFNIGMKEVGAIAFFFLVLKFVLKLWKKNYRVERVK